MFPITRYRPMQHTYWIGQIVRGRGRAWGRPRVTGYKVTRLLPGPADELPLYRVRSLPDGVEWVIAQHRLEPA